MKKYLNNIFKKRSIMIYFLISSFIIPLTILAETMQSGTYKIESDSINVGGQDSSSSNYRLRDTAGEAGTGDSNSGTYALRAGFWQLQDSYIALSTPSDLALTPIGGINGEASEGTIFWQVTLTILPAIV
jgi:hypothetical protein